MHRISIIIECLYVCLMMQAITGCQHPKPIHQLVIGITNNIDSIGFPRIAPKVFCDGMLVMLAFKRAPAGDYCWWDNSNLEQYIGKKLIVNLVPDSLQIDSGAISLDTVLVDQDHNFFYLLYIGAEPEHGASSLYYKRILMNGFLGDTIYLIRTIDDVLPAM